MCNFHTLYFGNEGYIVQCRYCGHYQVGFGTVVLQLEPADYMHLHHVIMQRQPAWYDEQSSDVKSILLQTPCNSTSLLLTPRELQALRYIFSEAENEATALSMMRLFNPQDS
jgi:hypothetical protein